MTLVHKLGDESYSHFPNYFVQPEHGNAVVVSVEEDRYNGSSTTKFGFPAYNVRDHTRPPLPGESLSEWTNATGARSNHTDRRESGYEEPPLITYPDVQIVPPLTDPDHIATAVGIVGTAFVRLREDPTLAPPIAAEFTAAGVPFQGLTVTATTTRHPHPW